MTNLTVITGPMFCGKSGELIRLIKNGQYAKKKILTIKPRLDNRQDTIRARAINEQGTSVTAAEHPSHSVDNCQEFMNLVQRFTPDILVIDEAQFFGNWIIEAMEDLLMLDNLKIYVAGLDQDAWGKTFGSMGDLMVLADEVKKLTAVCFTCGQPANLTFKQFSGQNQIEIGDIDKYEARCRDCWYAPL